MRAKTKYFLISFSFLFVGGVWSVPTSNDSSWRPRLYSRGDPVDLEVYRLTSLYSLLTYDYYDLPFCRPVHIKYKAFERKKNRLNVAGTAGSLYKIQAGVDLSCTELKRDISDGRKEEVSCARWYSQEELSSFVALMFKEYRVHFVVDGVPVSVFHVNPRNMNTRYDLGFPLGAHGLDGTSYLYNHLDFRFYYAEYKNGMLFIDSVDVEPGTIDNTRRGTELSEKEMCFRGTPLVIGMDWKPTAPKYVRWTYTVKWIKKANVTINDDRVARYKVENTSSVRWMSTLNVTLISLFAFSVVLIFSSNILSPSFSLGSGKGGSLNGSGLTDGEIRLAKYFNSDNNGIGSESGGNSDNELDEAEDDSTGKSKHSESWKHLSREMLTVPSCPLALSILVGVGLQVLISVCAIAGTIVINTVDSGDTKAISSIFCVTFCTVGSAVSGFFTGRMSKMLKVGNYIFTIVLNVALPPLFIFCIANWFQVSCGYTVSLVPTMRGLARKLALASPLVAICHFVGRKLPPMTILHYSDKKDDAILLKKKAAKNMSCLASLFLNYATSAVFPSGAEFVEIVFIVSAMWSYQIPDVGYLVSRLAFATLFVCSSVGIATVCFILSCDKARSWWWSPFHVNGFAAVYVAVFVACYYKYKIDFTDNASKVIYFTCMFFAIAVQYLMAAAVGFVASLIFVIRVSSKKKELN